MSRLLAGLTVGPEAFRARTRYRIRIDPVAEIRGARKRIRSILDATGLSRDDIEAISISSADARWQALSGIVTADRALANAPGFFEAQLPMQTSRSPRGRTGASKRRDSPYNSGRSPYTRHRASRPCEADGTAKAEKVQRKLQ